VQVVAVIDANHLLKEVIRPVLQDLRLGGEYAEALVLGTACQESRCGTWLVQLGGGPARGIYQMEPATHDDLWDRFIGGRVELMRRVNRWRTQYGNGMGADEMVGNLYYATAMCRVHYLRVPAPIPHDLPAQAAYWKRYYNSVLGAGTEQEYIESWRQFAPPMFV